MDKLYWASLWGPNLSFLHETRGKRLIDNASTMPTFAFNYCLQRESDLYYILFDTWHNPRISTIRKNLLNIPGRLIDRNESHQQSTQGGLSFLEQQSSCTSENDRIYKHQEEINGNTGTRKRKIFIGFFAGRDIHKES